MKVELAAVFLFALLVLHPSTMKSVAAAGEDDQNEAAVDTKKPSEGEEVKVDEKPSLVSSQESEKGDNENVNSDEVKTGGVKEKKQTSSDSKRATKAGKSSSKIDDSNTSEESNMSEEEGGRTRKTNVVARSSNSRRTTKQKGSKKTDDSADEEEVEPLSDDEIQQLRAGLMFRGADEDKAKADPDAAAAAAAAAGKDKIAAVVTTSAPTAAKAGGNTIKTSTLFTSSLGALSLLVIAFRHGFPGSM